MRKTFASVMVGGLLAASFASTATADILVVPIGTSIGPDPEVILVPFDLPDVLDIKSISIDITHTFAGDIVFDVFAPDGADFQLVNNDGGASDLTGKYLFVESGGGAAGTWGAGPGTYNANAWAAGPWAAGSWLIRIEDLFFGDQGFVGDVIIDYNPIPAPGALALLGLAGVAGRRRRRRA